MICANRFATCGRLKRGARSALFGGNVTTARDQARHSFYRAGTALADNRGLRCTLRCPSAAGAPADKMTLQPLQDVLQPAKSTALLPAPKPICATKASASLSKRSAPCWPRRELRLIFLPVAAKHPFLPLSRPKPLPAALTCRVTHRQCWGFRGREALL